MLATSFGKLFTFTMSVWSSYKLLNKLPHLFGLVLLCLGYFNPFLISVVVKFFMQISYLTGRVLVSKFLTLCDYAVQGVGLVNSFFKVIYEDLLIFIKDAADEITFVGLLLKDCYLFLENEAVIASLFIWDILKVLQAVLEVFWNLLIFLQFIFTTIKDGLTLIGATIWQFITSIPEVTLHHMKNTTDLIINTIDVAIDHFFLFRNQIIFNLEKLHGFLFNIPLDSFYGLVVGGLFLTILYFKFKDICFIIACGLLKVYRYVISFCISLWSGRFLESRTRNYHNGDSDDILCVVCQYQYKEIIIFPCKHLCLCWKCSLEIVNTHHTCPICRTQIRDTMKVYL